MDEVLGPQKAVVGAIISGVLAFLTPIQVTLTAGEEITGLVWLNSTIAALVFAAAVFGSVYETTNKPKGL